MAPRRSTKARVQRARHNNLPNLDRPRRHGTQTSARMRAQPAQNISPDLNRRRRNAIQTSGFFRLPQELKEEIYKNVLPARIGCVLVQAAGNGRSKNHRISIFPPPPITQLCKQLRDELSNRLYDQALTQATVVSFEAYDFNFSALQAYMTIRAASSPNGLAAFTSPYVPNVAPANTHDLIIQLRLSEEWCAGPDPTGLATWSKFVKDVAHVTDTDQFADYQFLSVENKKLAYAALDGLTYGPGTDIETVRIRHAFLRWYRFEGDKQKEAKFDRALTKQRNVNNETDFRGDLDDEALASMEYMKALGIGEPED